MCDPDGPLGCTAVMDTAVRELMEDRDRSLGILQRVTGDEALKTDLSYWSKDSSLVGDDAIVDKLDQRELLLFTATGRSDAALCRRFLIDRATAVAIRKTHEARYVKLFTWLDIYRKDTVTRGFGYHDGTRKYLDGLKSSDINKKQRPCAQQSNG